MKTTFRFSVLLALLFCATVVRAQSQNCSSPSGVHQLPDKITPGSAGPNKTYVASQTVTYIVTCINPTKPGVTFGPPQTNSVTATGGYSLTLNQACNPTFGTGVVYNSSSFTPSKFENLGYDAYDKVDPVSGHDYGCTQGMTHETDTICQPQACVSTGCVVGCNPPNCLAGCITPIIIDTTGSGFALTNAANGVKFDMSGTGTPIQIAWTVPNSNNAFLCLPDANGACDDGRDLFGNFTPQPASSTRNGFAALAVYDQPTNGGNGDGVIDARDSIFSSLRLWIDTNHDGISQPNEIFTLPQLGITSISLNYKVDERTDQHGNVFRYRAQVGSTDGAGRMAYDVFLVTDPTTAAKACPPRPLITLKEEKTLLR